MGFISRCRAIVPRSAVAPGKMLRSSGCSRIRERYIVEREDRRQVFMIEALECLSSRRGSLHLVEGFLDGRCSTMPTERRQG